MHRMLTATVSIAVWMAPMPGAALAQPAKVESHVPRAGSAPRFVGLDVSWDSVRRNEGGRSRVPNVAVWGHPGGGPLSVLNPW